MRSPSSWRAAPGSIAQTATDNPHVGYVFPAGGCRGTTFEVVVGGQYLKEVDRAYISGGGVQTRIVRWYRPLTDGNSTPCK